MQMVFTIMSIASLAIGVLCLRMALDVKIWRLRWMDFLGVLDVETERDLRKVQELQMSFMCIMLFTIWAAISASCAYWTYDEIVELKRDRTIYEQMADMNRQEIDRVLKRGN
jgi:hypothetical protein